MDEIWKDIPNYEGLYQASTLGRVKKLRTLRKCTHKFMVYKEQIITPNMASAGYLKLGLRKNQKRETIMVHQVMAFTFLGHKRSRYALVVNHKNHDKLDNRLVNLEIVTQRENANRKHVKSSSQYTGVSWHIGKKKWSSQIRINQVLNYLGDFDDELEASKAYQNALAEHLKQTA